MEEEEADLSALEQPITGGTLTNDAYPSVARLLASSSCTATKIGPFKWLTAAHCVREHLAASRLTMIVDGAQMNMVIPPGGVQVHPSYTLIELGNGAASADYYDVAVITTTSSTTPQGLSPASAISPIRQVTTVTGVGFGCDLLQPSHDGKQQSAQFDLELLNSTHAMIDLNNPSQCEGDSGGPGLSNTDGKIVGIMARGVSGSQTFFERISNVIGWINNPVPGNDPSLFQGSGALYFMHNQPASGGLLGLCMATVASSGSNIPVELSDCTDLRGQLANGRAPGWGIAPVSPVGTFVILDAGTGNCLAPGGSGPGANLRVETCAVNFADNRQKWSFTTTEGSPVRTLRIKNRSTGLCIKTENASAARGTRVEQFTCDSGQPNTSQSWVATR